MQNALKNGNEGKTLIIISFRGYDNTFICQFFFEETCYESNRKRLKPSVVPTKFTPFADVVCESTTSRKRKVECCVMEVVDTSSKKDTQTRLYMDICKLIKLQILYLNFVTKTSKLTLLKKTFIIVCNYYEHF